MFRIVITFFIKCLDLLASKLSPRYAFAEFNTTESLDKITNYLCSTDTDTHLGKIAKNRSHEPRFRKGDVFKKVNGMVCRCTI